MNNPPEVCPPPGSHPVVPNRFVEDHLSKTPIKAISAFLLEQQCGKNHIVIGKKARALFKDGLPDVDTDALNTKAKLLLGEELQYLTEPVSPEEISRFKLSEKTSALGLYCQFVREFPRLGLTIQGREFVGGESLDNDLQAFVKQVDGEQKARIISRLMHRGLADMALILFASDKKISKVLNGRASCTSAPKCQGTSWNIRLNRDGRVTVNVKSNSLGNNGIYQCLESQVMVSGFDRTPQIDEAKVLVMLISPG